MKLDVRSKDEGEKVKKICWATEVCANPPDPEGEHGPPKPTYENFVTLHGVLELNAYVVERRAMTAFPLLLAIHRRMEMAKESSLALGPVIWKEAGDPSPQTRRTMLAHLRRLSELVALRRRPGIGFGYIVDRGPLWLRIERTWREKSAGRKVR
jgi:hypothetical protein